MLQVSFGGVSRCHADFRFCCHRGDDHTSASTVHPRCDCHTQCWSISMWPTSSNPAIRQCCDSDARAEAVRGLVGDGAHGIQFLGHSRSQRLSGSTLKIRHECAPITSSDATRAVLVINGIRLPSLSELPSKGRLCTTSSSSMVEQLRVAALVPQNLACPTHEDYRLPAAR
jgi:hypothetical protein